MPLRRARPLTVLLGLLCSTLGACAPADQRAASATSREVPKVYSLRGVYFNPVSFSSTAECLTAAHTQGLPLDACR